MRTNIDAIVTNCNVFGFGQDRAVATCIDELCAHAAQHLAKWHSSKSVRSWSRVLKRRDCAVAAGVIPVVRLLCLAITGRDGQPVRRMSPALVMA